MANEKWFYPAQKKITDYLKEKFGENYRCEFQDVCKYVAYETYQCWKPKEPGFIQEQQRITFVIHKPVSKADSCRAIIEVMHSVYEDTMQYFKDSERPCLVS